MLLLSVIVLTSCDALDELTEIDITDDFSTTINIAIAEEPEGMQQSFSESVTLDIATNSEIQDNLNLIQNVNVNSVTYEVANFSGAEGAIITDASFSFGNNSIALANLNLQESDTNNTTYNITDTALLNSIGTTLENNTQVTIAVNGIVDSTPVTFNVIITLDITVTIDVL